MDVKALQDQDRARWDEYVQRSDRSTFFHLAGWQQVMEGTYGSDTRYLLASEGRQVVGILPLLHVKSRLSGHYLTSLPGGMCASNDEAAHALLEKARELLRLTGAEYLILRDGLYKWDLPQLVTNEDHCTFLLDLSPGLEQVQRRFKRTTRQQINQAIKSDLQVVTGTDTLDRYYPVYLQAMRANGTPTQGLRFFRNVIAQFPTNVTLQVVQREQKILGGFFIAPFKDTVYCTWSGTLRRFYSLCPNQLLYWEAIQLGCEHGYRWVDLGRCRRDSGGFIFKKHWGGEPKTLYQQYYLNGIRQPPPVGSDMVKEPHYRLFVSIWRRMPLSVTQVLGPWFRKRMPFG